MLMERFIRSYVAFVGRQSHDCEGISIFVRRSRRSSLASSSLRCKVAAGYKIASAGARVTPSFSPSRKIVYASVCVRERMVLA